jgi:hypothetical protein
MTFFKGFKLPDFKKKETKKTTGIFKSVRESLAEIYRADKVIEDFDKTYKTWSAERAKVDAGYKDYDDFVNKIERMEEEANTIEAKGGDPTVLRNKIIALLTERLEQPSSN